MSDQPRNHFQLSLRFRATLLAALVIPLAHSVAAKPAFEEVAASVGISFAHESGAVGKRWTLEITGPGVGLLDFDGDGRLDIWAIQGGPLKDRSSNLPSDRLFRNVSTPEGMKFIDVTDTQGLAATQYGMGVAVADIDNDGDVDVFLANYGKNQLFINLDGKLVEKTNSTLSEHNEWSLSASFADLNADGLLDLYVANYMDFPPLDEYKVCRRLSTRKSYCAPSNFDPVPDRLYLNSGNGEFKDVSESSGIAALSERGMGVIVDDFNADNRPDIYGSMKETCLSPRTLS